MQAKTVFKGVLDHTSVLKFIAQKFGNGGPYSDLVDQRAVGSILDVLNLDAPGPDIPTVPPLDDYLNKQPPAAGYTPGTVPTSPISQAFKGALDKIRELPPDSTATFSELLDKFPPT